MARRARKKKPPTKKAKKRTKRRTSRRAQPAKKRRAPRRARPVQKRRRRTVSSRRRKMHAKVRRHENVLKMRGPAKFFCGSFTKGPPMCVPAVPTPEHPNASLESAIDAVFAEAARRGDEFGMPLTTWKSWTDKLEDDPLGREELAFSSRG